MTIMEKWAAQLCVHRNCHQFAIQRRKKSQIRVKPVYFSCKSPDMIPLLLLYWTKNAIAMSAMVYTLIKHQHLPKQKINKSLKPWDVKKTNKYSHAMIWLTHFLFFCRIRHLCLVCRSPKNHCFWECVMLSQSSTFRCWLLELLPNGRGVFRPYPPFPYLFGLFFFPSKRRENQTLIVKSVEVIR